MANEHVRLGWYLCHILEANLASKDVVQACGGRTVVRVAGRFVISAWKRLCTNLHNKAPETDMQLTLEDYKERNAVLEDVCSQLRDAVDLLDEELGNYGPITGGPAFPAVEAYNNTH